MKTLRNTLVSLTIFAILAACSTEQKTYDIETMDEADAENVVIDTATLDNKDTETLTQPAATADDGGSKSIDTE